MNRAVSREGNPAAPAPVSDLRRGPALTVFPILVAISMGHLLNDTMQSTVTALFPVLRDELRLSYTQIGTIALVLNLTASLLQLLVGRLSDMRPTPRILPIGACFSLAGIVALALAPTYAAILAAVVSIGIGSAIFHPESSRVAYLAAGPRRGFAQSIFQVGGNIGHATGPVMTAVLFAHVGQRGVIWLAIVAAAAVAIQLYVAKWYQGHVTRRRSRQDASPPAAEAQAIRPVGANVVWAMSILVVLVISKQVYLSGISSFYTFYMIEVHGVGISQSQWFLFAFLASAAVGTFVGGPLADRIGRRKLIWFSILGTAPFSLLLPHANLFWSGILASAAGFVLSSAFSIIVVYAQELLPDRIGLVSGLFFGLAFGIGGLGSALLGWIADLTSIATVMIVISFLPLIGMLTAWLPKDEALAGREVYL